MITIEDTICIAVKAHRGAKDLEGKPVILHPLRVGLMGQNEDEIIAGVLHDVVEDTEITISYLEEQGVSDKVLKALELLTHNEEETYREYIERLAKSNNMLAMRVKLNDLTHNIERGKQYGHQSLVKRHESAYEYLVSAMNTEKVKLFENQDVGANFGR